MSWDGPTTIPQGIQARIHASATGFVLLLLNDAFDIGCLSRRIDGRGHRRIEAPGRVVDRRTRVPPRRPARAPSVAVGVVAGERVLRVSRHSIPDSS